MWYNEYSRTTIVSGKRCVQLLRDAYKGGTFGHVFDAIGVDVGAGTAQSTQIIVHCMVEIAFVWNFQDTTFGRPVRSHAAKMHYLCFVGTHAMKRFETLVVFFDHVARVLVVTGKLTAHHDEIGTAAKRFGHVSRTRNPAIGNDVSTHTMGRVGAFQDGRQLGHTDPGFQPSGTGAAGANPDFHNVHFAVENEFFHHFAGHHIAGDDNFVWECLADAFAKLDQFVHVAVRDVDANPIAIGGVYGGH